LQPTSGRSSFVAGLIITLSVCVAVPGIPLFTLFVLVVAALRIRRMEITYSTD